MYALFHPAHYSLFELHYGFLRMCGERNILYVYFCGRGTGGEFLAYLGTKTVGAEEIGRIGAAGGNGSLRGGIGVLSNECASCNHTESLSGYKSVKLFQCLFVMSVSIDSH